MQRFHGHRWRQFAFHDNAFKLGPVGERMANMPKTFTYDPHENHFLKMLFTYRSTVAPYVFRLPGFWFFLVVHLGFWTLHRLDYLEEYDKPGALFSLMLKDLTVISAITTFFEVFYTSQCYMRYLHLHHLVNQVFQTSHRYCFLLKTFCDNAGLNYVWLSMRWMRTSMVLFFIDLRQGGLQKHQWDDLLAMGWVKPEEYEILRNLNSPQRTLVLLNWMAHVTLAGCDRAELKNPPCVKGIIDRLILYDAAQKAVLEVHRMPVPFQYFHLLNVMICINISLWAYGMAMTNSVFGPVVFFLASFTFMGMVELGKQLADPFGEDEVDFPIHIWLPKCIENQVTFIEYDYKGKAMDFEAAIARETKPSVDAFSIGNVINPHAQPVLEEEERLRKEFKNKRLLSGAP